ARPAATAKHNIDARTRRTLLELALELLGMVEVRYERGTNLLDQALELCVLGIRDQHLVDRAEHLLVIGHFVLDVGFVERRSVETLEVLEIFLAALLEALAGRIVLRLDAELLHERRRLIVHSSMVGDHGLAESLDVLVAAFRFRKLARVD